MEFLREVVDRFDQWDVAAARREFSVSEMHELGLYKVHPEEPDDDAFARVLAELRAYVEHCRAVVTQGLDPDHHPVLIDRQRQDR